MSSAEPQSRAAATETKPKRGFSLLNKAKSSASSGGGSGRRLVVPLLGRRGNGNQGKKGAKGNAAAAAAPTTTPPVLSVAFNSAAARDDHETVTTGRDGADDDGGNGTDTSRVSSLTDRDGLNAMAAVIEQRRQGANDAVSVDASSVANPGSRSSTNNHHRHPQRGPPSPSALKIFDKQTNFPQHQGAASPYGNSSNPRRHSLDPSAVSGSYMPASHLVRQQPQGHPAPQLHQLQQQLYQHQQSLLMPQNMVPPPYQVQAPRTPQQGMSRSSQRSAGGAAAKSKSLSPTHKNRPRRNSKNAANSIREPPPTSPIRNASTASLPPPPPSLPPQGSAAQDTENQSTTGSARVRPPTPGAKTGGSSVPSFSESNNNNTTSSVANTQSPSNNKASASPSVSTPPPPPPPPREGKLTDKTSTVVNSSGKKKGSKKIPFDKVKAALSRVAPSRQGFEPDATVIRGPQQRSMNEPPEQAPQSQQNTPRHANTGREPSAFPFALEILPDPTQEQAPGSDEASSAQDENQSVKKAMLDPSVGSASTASKASAMEQKLTEKVPHVERIISESPSTESTSSRRSVANRPSTPRSQSPKPGEDGRQDPQKDNTMDGPPPSPPASPGRALKRSDPPSSPLHVPRSSIDAPEEIPSPAHHQAPAPPPGGEAGDIPKQTPEDDLQNVLKQGKSMDEALRQTSRAMAPSVPAVKSLDADNFPDNFTFELRHKPGARTVGQDEISLGDAGDGDEKQNDKEKGGTGEPVKSFTDIVGNITRQIQAQLDKVADLDIAEYLSPNNSPKKEADTRKEPWDADANDHDEEGIRHDDGEMSSAATESDDSPMVNEVESLGSFNPRNLRATNGQQTTSRSRSRSRSRRHQELVAAGDGSMRDRILRHTASSKAKTKAPVKSSPLKKSEKKSGSSPSKSSNDNNLTNDPADSLNVDGQRVSKLPPSSPSRLIRVGKKAQEKRRKTLPPRTSETNIRAAVSKKASAMAKKHAKTKEISHEEAKVIAREALMAATKQEKVSLPEEISLSQHEIVSDLDQSVRHFPLNTVDAEGSEAVSALEVPSLQAISFESENPSINIGDRYAPLNGTPNAELRPDLIEEKEPNKPADRYETWKDQEPESRGNTDDSSKAVGDSDAATKDVHEERILADDITEWTTSDPEVGVEGIEMVFKERPKSVDWDIKSKKSKTEESLGQPPKAAAFCGTGALLHALAISDEPTQTQTNKSLPVASSVTQPTDQKALITKTHTIDDGHKLQEEASKPVQGTLDHPVADDRYQSQVPARAHSGTTPTKATSRSVKNLTQPEMKGQDTSTGEEGLVSPSLSVLSPSSRKDSVTPMKTQAVALNENDSFGEPIIGSQEFEVDSATMKGMKSSGSKPSRDHGASPKKMHEKLRLTVIRSLDPSVGSGSEREEINEPKEVIELTSFDGQDSRSGFDEAERYLGNVQTSSQWTDIKSGELASPVDKYAGLLHQDPSGRNPYEEIDECNYGHDEENFEKNDNSRIHGEKDGTLSPKAHSNLGKPNLSKLVVSKDSSDGGNSTIPGSGKEGASQVKVLTEHGEATLLLTPSSKADLKARAGNTNANNEVNLCEGEEHELIDLTAIGSFEDLGIVDEAVWLFDVSPRNSVDQDLWQPKSNDLDSVMDLAVARLTQNNERYHEEDQGEDVLQKASTTVKDVLAYASKLVRSESSDSGMSPLLPSLQAARQQMTTSDTQQYEKSALEARYSAPNTSAAPVVVVVQGQDVGPVDSTVVGVVKPNEESNTPNETMKMQLSTPGASSPLPVASARGLAEQRQSPSGLDGFKLPQNKSSANFDPRGQGDHEPFKLPPRKPSPMSTLERGVSENRGKVAQDVDAARLTPRISTADHTATSDLRANQTIETLPLSSRKSISKSLPDTGIRFDTDSSTFSPRTSVSGDHPKGAKQTSPLSRPVGTTERSLDEGDSETKSADSEESKEAVAAGTHDGGAESSANNVLKERTKRENNQSAPFPEKPTPRASRSHPWNKPPRIKPSPEYLHHTVYFHRDMTMDQDFPLLQKKLLSGLGPNASMGEDPVECAMHQQSDGNSSTITGSSTKDSSNIEEDENLIPSTRPSAYVSPVSQVESNVKFEERSPSASVDLDLRPSSSNNKHETAIPDAPGSTRSNDSESKDESPQKTDATGEGTNAPQDEHNSTFHSKTDFSDDKRLSDDNDEALSGFSSPRESINLLPKSTRNQLHEGANSIDASPKREDSVEVDSVLGLVPKSSAKMMLETVHSLQYTDQDIHPKKLEILPNQELRFHDNSENQPPHPGVTATEKEKIFRSTNPDMDQAAPQVPAISQLHVGSLHEPTSETDTREQEEVRAQLTSKSVSKKDLLDIFFEGAEALVCGRGATSSQSMSPRIPMPVTKHHLLPKDLEVSQFSKQPLSMLTDAASQNSNENEEHNEQSIVSKDVLDCVCEEAEKTVCGEEPNVSSRKTEALDIAPKDQKDAIEVFGEVVESHVCPLDNVKSPHRPYGLERAPISNVIADGQVITSPVSFHNTPRKHTELSSDDDERQRVRSLSLLDTKESISGASFKGVKHNSTDKQTNESKARTDRQNRTEALESKGCVTNENICSQSPNSDTMQDRSGNVTQGKDMGGQNQEVDATSVQQDRGNSILVKYAPLKKACSKSTAPTTSDDFSTSSNGVSGLHKSKTNIDDTKTRGEATNYEKPDEVLSQTDRNVQDILNHPAFTAALQRYLSNGEPSRMDHIRSLASTIETNRRRGDPPTGQELLQGTGKREDPPSHGEASLVGDKNAEDLLRQTRSVASLLSHEMNDSEAVKFAVKEALSESSDDDDVEEMLVELISGSLKRSSAVDAASQQSDEHGEDQRDAYPSNGEDDVNQRSWIEETDEGVEVRVEHAKDEDPNVKTNGRQGDVNSMLASDDSIDGTPKKQDSSDTKNEISLPLQTGQSSVMEVIEDSIEQICFRTSPRQHRPSTEHHARTSPDKPLKQSETGFPRKELLNEQATEGDETLDARASEVGSPRSNADIDHGDLHTAATRPFRNKSSFGDGSGSLVISDYDSGAGVDPNLGQLMNLSSSQHSTARTAVSDDDSAALLLALTRSEGTESHAGADPISQDPANSYSKVEQLRMMHDSRDSLKSALHSPSSVSSVEPITGSSMENQDRINTFERSPKIESVMERIRQRRENRQDVRNDPSSSSQGKNDAGPVDADALFSRYNNIVKGMVLSDSTRLERAQEQKAVESNGYQPVISSAALLDDEISSRSSKPQLPQRSNSIRKSRENATAPGLKNSGSHGSSSEQSTPSEKARDLRRQLDHALQTSVAIRGTQERLTAEISTFKNRLQHQRKAVRSEVAAIAAGIVPGSTRSSGNRLLSPIASSSETDTDYNAGGETSGSETDEDDVRLRQLDSIIHGLRDAQRRQTDDDRI